MEKKKKEKRKKETETHSSTFYIPAELETSRVIKRNAKCLVCEQMCNNCILDPAVF